MREDPAFAAAVRTSLRKVRGILYGPSAEDVLQSSLKGLPVALDPTRLSLDASRRGLQTQDVLLIVSALQMVPPGTIQRLNLSHTSLSMHAATELAGAHLALSALTALRLRGCSLRDGGVRLLCEALHDPSASASSQLSELALASNGLTSACASDIAAAVRELPALLTIDLSYNELGNACCITIAESLGERCVLQSLSLASVAVDDEGVTRLASALSAVPLLELVSSASSPSPPVCIPLPRSPHLHFLHRRNSMAMQPLTLP